MRYGRSRVPLALMEQIIMILVFALASAACLQAFAYSARLSKTDGERQNALAKMRQAAEYYKASQGDLEQVGRSLERAGWVAERIGQITERTGQIAEQTGQIAERTGQITERTGQIAERTGRDVEAGNGVDALKMECPGEEGMVVSLILSEQTQYFQKVVITVSGPQGTEICRMEAACQKGGRA